MKKKLFYLYTIYPPSQNWLYFVFRQIISVIFFILGIGLSMPGIPGPGIIFLALSLLLFSYPGKEDVLQWLSTKRSFRRLRAILRRRFRIVVVLPKKRVLPGTTPVDWLKYVIVFVFRAMLIGALIFSLHNGQFQQAGLAILTFALTFIPSLAENKFKVNYPSEFEILVMLIIFLSLYLGVMNAFYDRFWWWDVMLHGLTSMAIAIFAFSLVVILNEEKYVRLKNAFFISLFSFSFAMMIGAVWEIFEFSMDQIFGFRMQRHSLVDTMEDLIVDGIGALGIATLGYFYLKYEVRLRLVTRFKKMMNTFTTSSE